MGRVDEDYLRLLKARYDKARRKEMVAFKLKLWGWDLGKEQRGGLTTPQFVRKALMTLQMGEYLTHIVRGGTKRPIATAEEVLALTERT